MDVQLVLGGNHEMVNDVLTLAYFPFIENLSYNQLSQWQKEVKAPSEHELNSVSITRLTQSITERHRMDLFRCRARRVGRDELCAVDSTSMSTYGFNLVDIRWGKNKERLPLRQTLEVVVYSLTSHMPFFYKKSAIGSWNALITTDMGIDAKRAFRTLRPEDGALSQGRAHKEMKGLLNSGQMPVRGLRLRRAGCCDNLLALCMEYSVKGNGDNVIKADKYRLNLYYNPLKRGEKICDIQHSVSEQSAELDIIIQTNEPVADREDTARSTTYSASPSSAHL